MVVLTGIASDLRDRVPGLSILFGSREYSRNLKETKAFCIVATLVASGKQFDTFPLYMDPF